MSAQDTSMGRLFVVLLNHWQNSLFPLYQPLIGQPMTQTATYKGCLCDEVRQLVGLEERPAQGRTLGAGVRTGPQPPSLSLGGPFLMGWRELVEGVDRGEEGFVHWLDGIMSGEKVTDPVKPCGPGTTSSKMGLLSTKRLHWAVWCCALSLIFKITTNKSSCS